MMTVRELIELLSTLEPERVVILSSDREGNSYSPLDAYSEDYYVAETTYSGEVYPTLEEADSDDAVPCVVLAPVN